MDANEIACGFSLGLHPGVLVGGVGCSGEKWNSSMEGASVFPLDLPRTNRHVLGMRDMMVTGWSPSIQRVRRIGARPRGLS